MNTTTKIFLRKRFQEYYQKNIVKGPPEIHRREFGVGTLEQKIKLRHKAFPTDKDLHNYLKREAPYFISYSTAYYEFPSNEPMQAKNWQGADLTFDLDIDMNLLEKDKLALVKKETINLIDFLLTDFGFSKNDLSVNFSGSHGYHVHVFSDKVKNLGSDERREIVDYVSGEINFIDFLRIGEGNKIIGPNSKSKGWGGRIYSNLFDFIEKTDLSGLKNIKGIGKKKAELIIKERENILTSLKSGRYDRIHSDVMKIEKGFVQTGDPNKKESYIKNAHSPLIQKIIKEKAIKSITAEDTDKMVTIDTSRLIRLPDTIHGGSGLLAKRVLNIEKFNPLIDAISFLNGEEIKIHFEKNVPKFDFFDGSFGPYKEGENMKLPEPLGIFLILKGFCDFS